MPIVRQLNAIDELSSEAEHPNTLLLTLFIHIKGLYDRFIYENQDFQSFLVLLINKNGPQQERQYQRRVPGTRRGQIGSERNR